MTKSLHLEIDHECCFDVVPSELKSRAARVSRALSLALLWCPSSFYLHQCTQTELKNLLSSNFELQQ